MWGRWAKSNWLNKFEASPGVEEVSLIRFTIWVWEKNSFEALQLFKFTFNALQSDCGRDQEKKSKLDEITISYKNEAVFNL